MIRRQEFMWRHNGEIIHAVGWFFFNRWAFLRYTTSKETEATL